MHMILKRKVLVSKRELVVKKLYNDYFFTDD
jgi:hypothetical protein